MRAQNPHFAALFSLMILTLLAGCSDRDPTSLDIARAPIDPEVYTDTLEGEVYFQPFSGTYYEAGEDDPSNPFSGENAFKVTIPGRDSELGAYSGGVLTPSGARDLADFNALTFYARSSITSQLNEAGYGNDNTGNSLYSAGRSNIPLTTQWTFVVIPIPDSSKLIAERGLFTFAEGWEVMSQSGHEIWFDEIRFANLGNITNPRPQMDTVIKQYFRGSTVGISGTSTTFDIDGADVVVSHMPGYFDFTSANPDVAVVEDGEVKIIGVGNTLILGTMGDIPVSGQVIIASFEPPATAADAPTYAASDVVSLFSASYSDHPVDTWNPHWNWSTTEDSEYIVDGTVTKMYAALNFVGIEFLNNTVDASQMTHFHMDVYAPQGTDFSVKLVAFDGDNGLSVGDSELTFDATTTPAFTAGQWVSLEIPMADFGFTAPVDHLGQLVLSTTDAELVLVDNIYWHR